MAMPAFERFSCCIIKAVLLRASLAALTPLTQLFNARALHVVLTIAVPHVFALAPALTFTHYSLSRLSLLLTCFNLFLSRTQTGSDS
eukprot:6187987-Pleurochrysis_carterae.AAC.9